MYVKLKIKAQQREEVDSMDIWTAGGQITQRRCCMHGDGVSAI